MMAYQNSKNIIEKETDRDEVNRRSFLKASSITGIGIMGGNTLISQSRSTEKLEEAESQRPLRVMSYNIKHGGGGVDESYDLRRVAGQIWAADPDIVAIQEVDRELVLPSIDDPRSDFDDQPELLADWLNMDVRFYPQLSLAPKDGYRKEQIKELLDVSTQRDAPRIMAGDFNTHYESSNYKLLNNEYDDVLRETGDITPTFPASDPEIRIDYIFATDDVGIKNGRVININASDYLPIVAEIAVPTGRNGG